MKYFKKIIGERLYLSPINVEDVEIYTKWMNDLNVVKYIRQNTNIISLIGEKEYLENASKEKYNFAMVLKENDELIGNISLAHINEVNRTAELGIFIGEEKNMSKGYGTEAIKLLLDYGFNQLNLNNIMLKLLSFNSRAYKCYEKAGFRKFGIWKQSIYFNGKYYDEIFMNVLKKDFNKK